MRLSKRPLCLKLFNGIGGDAMRTKPQTPIVYSLHFFFCYHTFHFSNIIPCDLPPSPNTRAIKNYCQFPNMVAIFSPTALAQAAWSAWHALPQNPSVCKLPLMLKIHIITSGNLITHHNWILHAFLHYSLRACWA